MAAGAQRLYVPHSQLSSGNWYKIAVSTRGIYRIDIPFLNSLGVNTTNLSSSSIRLFGNGGHVLPEANNQSRPDDLLENAVQVVDGGDGQFNGNDYLLFFAEGPDKWINDSINSRFSHIKNIYSDRSYYFINIGGTGKRVQSSPLLTGAAVTVTGFSERYFHELDTVNFLSGGKEWYGEELSSLPGRSLVKNFQVLIPDPVLNSPLQLRTSLVSRSVGAPGRFDIRINNLAAGQPSINATGGGQYDLFGNEITFITSGLITQPRVDLGFSYVPGSFNAQGWINWFEIFTRRKLAMTGSSQLSFRDWNSVGNQAAEFIIQNAAAGLQVWDVTDPLNPLRMPGNFQNNEFRFTNDCSRLREYIAFNSADFLSPYPLGKIANQDLHQTSPADYLIISYPAFMLQAERLASIHLRQNGLRTKLVSTTQVFNEFSSGSPDPAALRDFVKMYYDKYGSSQTDKAKYLLLLGDASFDYKDRLKNNTSLVLSYQNNFSLDPLSTYTSDDFYGFLDDTEDINSGLVTNLLDIGIGRVPVKSVEEARNYIDKVEAYLSPQSFGPWRNNTSFVADDEDNNLHLQDAEIITATANSVAPVFNQQKIYLDAYHQESGAGGSSYPQAVQASNNQVYNGTLIWNYNGHGGAKRLAEETILDQSMTETWNNAFRLPLFITATCDFAPYDNPGIQSLGEHILLKPKTGAIALMTTTRVVFAFSNRVMNNNYLLTALQRNAGGKYKTLGDAVKETKNYTYQTSTDITNNRKFTLLGDPALTLGFPFYKVEVTRINALNASLADTLSATENVVVEGMVTDLQGNILPGFNGYVYPTIFDKEQTVQTLGNDAGSIVTGFSQQQNSLFRGKASVTNGRFSFTFKVPRDINFQYGKGRMSLYATDSVVDANGLFTNFFIGGAGADTNGDKQGPLINVFLNDEMFVNGGLTNENPVLILKLTDSSGINTTRTGIGHELVATLDNDNRQYFILNDFYEADLDNFRQGRVRFQLPALTPGNHTLHIKAWDVLNNSGEARLDFVVGSDGELEISHVLNYPNPFTSRTGFWFEHNKPGQPLRVDLQIMTITGRVIRSYSETIISAGNRSAELSWDGKDESGSRAGRGVYIYELRVVLPGKKAKTSRGKLVLL